MITLHGLNISNKSKHDRLFVNPQENLVNNVIASVDVHSSVVHMPSPARRLHRSARTRSKQSFKAYPKAKSPGC